MNVREPQPGEVIGLHYVIEKELGRGGFGVVFKARHIDIDRVVAIKVMLATYAQKDPTAKERFKREATIAASLDYPNTLRVFDYGETGEGVFYIVMEFLQGQELAKLIRREGRLPIPRAVHVVRQVLHALMEAHSRGIVHRDIKPDNVMLVSLSYDPDYVKVMDFGIAKMADSGDQITRVGLTLGTPRYMPIEQLKGERLSPATDLYAVGLVLYEMLVGVPAFVGDTAIDTAMAIIRGGPVKVPPEVALPPEIVTIIETASARESADRYQSARAFLEALNTLPPHLLDSDAADLERFATQGFSSRKTTPKMPAVAAIDHTPGTLMMPGVEPEIPEGGDFEDAIKTMTLEAMKAKAAMNRVEREAKTEAIDVTDLAAQTAIPTRQHRPHLAEVTSGPEPALTSNETQSVTALATSFADFKKLLARPSAPTWFGAPPILVVMNAAILVLLLLVLLDAA
jgi:serine/threonine protein kinase